MKDKVTKFIHSRLFVIILVSLLILITTFIGTYAWFTWSNPSDQNTSFTMSIGEIIDIEFINGNAINGNIDPVYNYTDGLSTSFTINNKLKNDSYQYNYNISFDITSIDDELISEDFKYKIISNNEVIYDGNFKDAVSGSSLILYSDILPKGESNYNIYFYIDGNVENDNNMMNKNINGYIMVDAYLANNAVEYIRNLYSSNNPTEITQYQSDGTTEQAKYYYSSSVNLMNDALGATVTDTTALVNGTKGNIRYYGASPNNYIYFNCDDYNEQSDSTCEKWRIIGIVDGKIKIVRDESIGNYSWYYTSTGERYNNNWGDSTLQELLNNGYYNNLDGISYYNNSTTPITINFKTDNNGIKNTETRKMISESTWYLGGYDYAGLHPNEMYEYERGNLQCDECTYDSPWTGNIGLMYVSDYGYASDLSVCNQTFTYYKNTNCKDTDWLFNNDYQWFIAPHPLTGGYVWYVKPSGDVYYLDFSVKYPFGVRPVLYLDPELNLRTEGDGSSESPYQFVVF